MAGPVRLGEGLHATAALSATALRYPATALEFGLVWYAVFQVPAATRGFLAGLGRGTAIALLCVVSLLVALVLRRFIANGANDVWLAVLAPCLGALLFGYAAAVTIWVRNGFRALDYADLFVRLPLWAVLTALAWFLLVIPTGYAAQRVMRRAAAQTDDDPSARSGERTANP